MSFVPTADPLLAEVGEPDFEFVMPHNHRVLANGDVVISNDFGENALLTPGEYQHYLRGDLLVEDPLFADLAKKGFIATKLDERELAAAYDRRTSFMRHGPNLHIVVASLRCDHTCRYCHASRVPMTRQGYDMTEETAEKVVDMIFQSPNQYLTIEFQGGEPLANWPVVKKVVEYAEEKNRYADKFLTFALVTNTTQMTDEKLDFLIDHRVEICTSVDGPEALHNSNRLFKEGNAHATVLSWIKKINDRYAEAGLDPSLYRVEALLTVTRDSLAHWKEIIDTYVDIGCRAVFLRALNPFGFASATAERIGYSMEDWLDFYEKSVEYIIELNKNGTEILERNAGIFLTKVLLGDEPNYLDIRSPCGGGIGQIAYNYDGGVFTCDEGRMVHEMGNDLFAMGDVSHTSYAEAIESPATRALVMSSTLDALPECAHCAYKPYCGVCPVHNFAEQASLHGRMADSTHCAKHMGILDYLFSLIRRMDTEAELAEVLTRWITVRPRDHFVHAEHEEL